MVRQLEQVLPSMLCTWHTHAHICTHIWATLSRKEGPDSHLFFSWSFDLFASAFEVYPCVSFDFKETPIT